MVSSAFSISPFQFFPPRWRFAGLAIAWQEAHIALGVSAFVWQSIAGFASLLFLGLLAIYGAKLLRFPRAVVAEWKHPVRVNFFPTISISLLLLGIVWLDRVPTVSRALWAAGMVIHLAFTFAILSSRMYLRI